MSEHRVYFDQMELLSQLEGLQSLTALLAHIRERLGVELGFVLWDGSTVPADLKPDALALALADEGAVAALIRRPRLDTLFNLLVSARLELRNGTLFDLMRQHPRVRSKDFRKALVDYTAAIRLEPKNGVLYAERGKLVASIGDLKRAMADFELALRLDPNQALVTLERPYHQLITNAFRNQWAYGQAPPPPNVVQNIVNTVYSQYPLPK